MDESAGAAAAPDIPSKVLKYEEFVNERLRPDLKQALDAEQEVANEMANCDQVCLLLRQFQQKEFTDKSELKVLTDIGCNFYTEAVVQDVDIVNVYLGLGVYLEMRTDDAITFIGKTRQMLEQKRNILIQKANHIQAHIKLVYQGLRELQNLSE